MSAKKFISVNLCWQKKVATKKSIEPSRHWKSTPLPPNNRWKRILKKDKEEKKTIHFLFSTVLSERKKCGVIFVCGINFEPNPGLWHLCEAAAQSLLQILKIPIQQNNLNTKSRKRENPLLIFFWITNVEIRPLEPIFLCSLSVAVRWF